MVRAKKHATAETMLDIRGAAALVGRHPETVRRWVWSGRLRARRQGNRLLVARNDVEALALSARRPLLTLAEWAERACAARTAGANGAGGSAADLLLEDRAHRSRQADAGAGP